MFTPNEMYLCTRWCSTSHTNVNIPSSIFVNLQLSNTDRRRIAAGFGPDPDPQAESLPAKTYFVFLQSLLLLLPFQKRMENT
jgi:hypothetical protein